MASRLPAGTRFGTKPPFAPTGTITAFLTCCALTRPSTSVRKSCGRSDHLMPPRATGPNRRCTASNRGEHMKISHHGRGSGIPLTLRLSSLSATARPLTLSFSAAPLPDPPPPPTLPSPARGGGLGWGAGEGRLGEDGN